MKKFALSILGPSFIIFILSTVGLAQTIYNKQDPLNEDSQLFNSLSDLNAKLHQNNIYGDTIQVNDSIYKYVGENNEWVLDGCKKVLSKDNNGNTLSEIELKYQSENNTWENHLLTYYSYYNNEADRINEKQTYLWLSNQNKWIDRFYQKNNENGDLSVYYNKIWDFNNNSYSEGIKYMQTYNQFGINNFIQYSLNTDIEQWEYVDKTSYLYNLDGQNIEKMHQDWSVVINDWIDIWQQFLSYDEEGYIQQIISQDWDNNLNSWINDQKSLYSFNDDGNNIEHEKLIWNIEYNCWVEKSLFLYGYDSNLNITEVINLEWDGINNMWGNSSRMHYTYDDYGNNVFRESQIWYNNSYWKSFDEWYFVYINNQLIEELHLKFAEDAWRNYQLEQYSYNSLGNLTQYTEFMGHYTTNEWFNEYKEEYFWSKYETNISNNKVQPLLVMVYPNPTLGKVNIVFKNGSTTPSNICVFNSDGRIVYDQFTTEQNIKCDLSDLPAGIYSIYIEDQSRGKSIQIIKQ